MDSDSWNSIRFSNPSRRYQTRSDLYFGGHDETDLDDDLRAEFICPFCAEHYDIVGLCCHIDEEHPIEAKNGVCPVCEEKVGMDLVGHITMQHGSFLKVHRKRRLRRAGSSSAYSLLRRELREGTLQSLFGASSCIISSNSEPDPLLSSFICNPTVSEEPLSLQSLSSIEASEVKESLKEDTSIRNGQQSQLSNKEQVEKARKSEFVQELLMSAIIDYNL